MPRPVRIHLSTVVPGCPKPNKAFKQSGATQCDRFWLSEPGVAFKQSGATQCDRFWLSEPGVAFGQEMGESCKEGLPNAAPLPLNGIVLTLSLS